MRNALSLSPSVIAPHEPPPLPDCLTFILKSRSFKNTPALRALLIFLWRYRDQQISEYAIATEALGRSPLFNAKTDATVRVQISRLRQRLEKFYEDEGKECIERLAIPLGSHQICIEQTSPTNFVHATSDLSPLTPVPTGDSKARAWIPLLICVCGLLVVICAALAIKLNRFETASKRAVLPSEPRFWKAFYNNGLATRIVLATPVFFGYKYGRSEAEGSVMVRDTNLNDFAGREQSPSIRAFSGMLGDPDLSHTYTVSSDTFAAVNLIRYLDRADYKTSVHSSADAVLESLDMENVIAIGTWGTLTPIAPYLEKMDFHLARHEDSVDVLNALAGEPKRVVRVDEAVDRAIWPGIVAVLPGHSGRTHLLVLAARYPSALVSFLTSSDGLEQLERLWRAKGSPEFYEVVVNLEMNGADPTPVRFWPTLLHARNRQ